MTRIKIVCALLAVLALSACYPPTTSHPVGTTVGLKNDPALVGLWKSVPPDKTARGVYIHFLPLLTGSISAILVETGDQPDGDWYYVTLTSTKLGANRFVNARMLIGDGTTEASDLAKGTVPTLYRFNAKGQLLLFMMDEDAVKAAILSGKIKGTVEKGQMGDAVITADPKALDAFLQTPAGLKLFSKPMFVLNKME
jgi:hypothetical protein